jgi:hypothetical protein
LPEYFDLQLPESPHGLSPEFLTGLLQQNYPGSRIVSTKLVEMIGYGEVGVSTSARVTLDLDYASGSDPALPRRAVVKMSLDNEMWRNLLHPQFENEVDVYNRLKPGLVVEAPLALGGHFDPVSNRYVLILEDLRVRGAHFQSVTDVTSPDTVRAVLDTHARLHASFWNSPRFSTDLAWYQTHLAGNVETFMQGKLRECFREEMDLHGIKRDLISGVAGDEESLFAQMCAVKRHQATLPQTIVHGDSHISNTYLLPDGSGGLYDWAVSARGFAMHDVIYHINTALPTELRRVHERDLLAFYRDRLGHYGVADLPDMETIWAEARRATIWGLYCWIPCVEEAYGMERLTIVLLRLVNAYRDHETRRMIAEVS